MATLRNRLAHGYASVDMERIGPFARLDGPTDLQDALALWTELPAGIEALERFSSAVAAHLAPV